MQKLCHGFFVFLFSLFAAAPYSPAAEALLISPQDVSAIFEHDYTAELIEKRKIEELTIQRQDRDTYILLGGKCKIVFQINRSGAMPDAAIDDVYCTNSSGFSVGN